MNTRVSRFINQGALPVCLAAMDSCWMYAVAWLFSTVLLSAMAVVPVPAPPLLAGLELGAWGLSVYLLDRTRLSLFMVRLVVGTVGVTVSALVALALNPQFDLMQFGLWLGTVIYSLAVCLALWAVGSYRASQRPGYELVYSNFRLGLIVLAITSVLAALLARYTVMSVWEGIGGVALWFVVWSLCALALGNREALRQETGNADARFWGGLLAASLVCVAVISSVSGVFTLGDLFEFIRQVIGTIVALVILAVGWIIYGIFWLMSLFRLPIRAPKPAPPPAPTTPSRNGGMWEVLRGIQEQARANQPLALSPELQTVLTMLVILLLVGMAAWLASRGLSRTRRDRVGNTGEERESLGSPWALLLAQMKAWFAWLLGLFRKTTPEAQPTGRDDLSSLEGRPEWAATFSIRQIYARLQSRAGQLGYPRVPQQTPAEYLAVLSKAMPDLHDDLTGITIAYMVARYGARPLPTPLLRTAVAAWERVEPALQKYSS